MEGMWILCGMGERDQEEDKMGLWIILLYLKFMILDWCG